MSSVNIIWYNIKISNINIDKNRVLRIYEYKYIFFF